MTATENKKISIHAKIPVKPFISAFDEYLHNSNLSMPKIEESLAGYFQGDYARHRSALHIIAAINNDKLFPVYKDYNDPLIEALSDTTKGAYICFALLCARYSFCYDVATALSGFFRLQDQVTKEQLIYVIGKEYGFNENVKRAMERFIYFCEEANIITRPAKPIMSLNPAPFANCEAVDALWKTCFHINEPLRDPSFEDDFSFEPFFRYLKLASEKT